MRIGFTNLVEVASEAQAPCRPNTGEVPRQPAVQFRQASSPRRIALSTLKRFGACLTPGQSRCEETTSRDTPSAKSTVSASAATAIRAVGQGGGSRPSYAGGLGGSTRDALKSLSAALRGKAGTPRRYSGIQTSDAVPDIHDAGDEQPTVDVRAARGTGTAAQRARVAIAARAEASSSHAGPSARAPAEDSVWNYMRSANPKHFWNNLQVAQQFTRTAPDQSHAFAEILLREIAESTRGDSVLPYLPEQAVKEMRPLLTSALRHIASTPRLDALDTGERGRLIALIRHPKLELPVQTYAFQARGVIDRAVAKEHASIGRKYIDAVAGDRSARALLSPANGVARLSDAAKDELTEKLVKHAALAMGLREPIYASFQSARSAEHALAAAVTVMGPTSRLTLTNDIFNKGAAFVLNTVLHEVEHVRQFHVDRTVRNKPLFASRGDAAKPGVVAESAGLRYYNVVMTEGDKQPAEDVYDHRYGRENERHGWAIGLGAAILAAKAGVTADAEHDPLKHIDIERHGGDVWTAARMHFEMVMGVPVKSLATLIPGAHPEASQLESQQAWEAIARLTQAHGAADKAGTLSVALLSGAPEIVAQSVKGNAPRDASQCATLLERAIEYALQSPDANTLREKLRDAFFPIFPKNPIQSEMEHTKFFDRIRTLAKNNCKSEFVRQVLFEAASLSLAGPGAPSTGEVLSLERLRSAVWPVATDR
ncbi:hypothetical protein FSO04_37315 [Paraburkholderia madseniana]|uniref:Uncharacterized protein n=1 Tax=Paraburkholderia madseniana TaxID=2599607 RepID=A0A6N6W3D0_9BURK|nr:hypothetical protein [Paraburkholderia madseniana]KAE8754886.1 hypothetical protein FSO04_37315 [Paraburkholderia madseniana]